MKKPRGDLTKLFSPCSRSWAAGEEYSPDARREKAVGDRRRQTPRARPIKKPPMCEKLSNPGRRPSANAITTSMTMKSKSLIGLGRSFHVYSRSRSRIARMPKSEPEQPVDAMPLAAKLPPRTKPKMPAAKYKMAKRKLPIKRSTSRPSVICSSRLKPM